MKLNNKLIKRLALPTIIAVALSSCVKNSEPTYFSGPYHDFANVTAYNGNTMLLEVFGVNSETATTISSDETTFVKPEKYPVGSRVLVTYNLTSDIVSTIPNVIAIQLTEIQKAITPEITTVAEPSTGRVAITVLEQPYRAGKYLNLRASLPKRTDYEYSCTVSETSLASSRPQIYIAINHPENADQTATSDDEEYMTCPISVNLSPVWQSIAGKEFDIHINVKGGKSDMTYGISAISA